MKQGLKKLFQKFDTALKKELVKARAEGAIHPIPKITCKIVGQVALLLAELPFDISATTDIDIVFDPPHEKNKILEKLCLDFGLTLEPDHELIWMPNKTVYHPLYQGKLVKAFFADPLYVITSKCKFKREKDKKLIQNYFQYFPKAKNQIEKMGVQTKWVW